MFLNRYCTRVWPNYAGFLSVPILGVGRSDQKKKDTGFLSELPMIALFVFEIFYF